MSFTPGDILLVNDYSGGSDLIGNLIRAGERARYGDTDFARWTHSAMIVTEDGDLVEALANGIRRTNVSKYAQHETLIVHPPVTPKDPRRGFAVRFALAHVGVEYDYLDFFFLAASLLTRLDLSVHFDKAYICSGLCARATECYTEDGYQFAAEQMMPADLADHWGAITGECVPPISFIGRTLDKLKAVCWALSPFRSGLRPTGG